MMWKLGDRRTLACCGNLQLLLSIYSKVLFGDLAGGDSPLAVYPLVLYGVLVLYAHDILKGIDAPVSNKSKPSWLPGPLVLQNGTIFNIAILQEVLLEFFIAQVVRKTPNEYFSKLWVQGDVRWGGT